ncbi:hypothetical protein SAMN05661008_01502 [Alkalithermobacter thermoalcaliphilus JW-YL-7 = DSM 7308]|uniref:Uncharacterized protein n=1 Tax=Alkalithermobacter thermoalcaliphilus JW-YL-7 = DSM 7308 TaxID=1121328 RepID=A0A150FR39_CLOPD|nr:hypothetical protein JWYL7_1113 [[Clostridium] paradoxum JW-YL-7 = DSM 7308]SHL12749.1 hypothetical protein SAMN05661008_01502 [[Clostridium] paradoxum JW-YL-7 = DSM 7308]
MRLSEKEKEYIKKNYKKLGTVQIAKDLGRPISTISQYAGKIGIREKRAYYNCGEVKPDLKKIPVYKLEKGKWYEVTKMTIEAKGNTKQREVKRLKYIDETKRYYIFEHELGFKECILKNTPEEELKIKKI